MKATPYAPSNILIHTKEGLVLQELSYLAIDKHTNKVVAVGNEAASLLNDPAILVANPFRQGRIDDFIVCEKLIKYCIKKTDKSGLFKKPKLAWIMPDSLTEIEKKAYSDILFMAGCKEPSLIEDPAAHELIPQLIEKFHYSAVIEILAADPADYLQERVTELLKMGRSYGYDLDQIVDMIRNQR